MAEIEAFRDEYLRSHRRDRGEESVTRSVNRYIRALESVECTATDCEIAETHYRETEDCTGRLGWFDWLREEGEKVHAEATPRDVSHFLDYLYSIGMSGSSQRAARMAISQYHKKLGLEGQNPVDGLDDSWSTETEKERRHGGEPFYLEPDQVQALVDNVPTPTLRNELIVKLLYATGVRRSELASIEVDRLDIKDQEIEVWDEKDEDWRMVGFRPGLQGALRLWVNGQRKDAPGYTEENPYLFPSYRGENPHIAGDTVYRVVTEAAERAGLQTTYGDGDSMGREQHLLTPHALRASFAVQAARNQLTPDEIKEVLGHTKLEVTQIYTAVAEEDAVDRVKQAGPSL